MIYISKNRITISGPDGWFSFTALGGPEDLIGLIGNGEVELTTDEWNALQLYVRQLQQYRLFQSIRIDMPIEITRERRLLPGNVISFVYTNWKGRTARRMCSYQEMCLGVSQMPDSEGKAEILLIGWDLDKQARRSYHVSGIQQGSVELVSERSIEMSEPVCICEGFYRPIHCPVHGTKARALKFSVDVESERRDG